jgi:hypothetical protein
MRTGVALLAVALGVAAQTPPETAARASSGALGWFVGSGSSMPSAIPVAPKPYSAEQITERVQTLADGTHITQTTPITKLFRDSAGRTRTEHAFSAPPGAPLAVPSLIEISDSVAGYRYVLNERTQTARRMSTMMRRSDVIMPAKVHAPVVQTPAPVAITAERTRPYPETSRESLGTQVIEGVLTEGTRFTTTYPVGSIGNDQPVTTVQETWTSPDLQAIVLSKTSDPRNGQSTTKLTNIVIAEPDPALFQVPAEYSIVGESAPGIR